MLAVLMLTATQNAGLIYILRRVYVALANNFPVSIEFYGNSQPYTTSQQIHGPDVM